MFNIIKIQSLCVITVIKLNDNISEAFRRAKSDSQKELETFSILRVPNFSDDFKGITYDNGMAQ